MLGWPATYRPEKVPLHQRNGSALVHGRHRIRWIDILAGLSSSVERREKEPPCFQKGLFHEHLPRLLVRIVTIITVVQRETSLFASSLRFHETRALLSLTLLEMADHDGDAFYKKQLEIAAKERKLLQERLEALEKENRELRRSVFELSLRRSALGGVFDLTAALDGAPAVNDRNEEAAEALRSAEERPTLNDPRDLALEAAPAARAVTAPAMSSGAFTQSSSQGRRGSLICRAQLTGHKGAVYALSWSPCGRYLASGAFDRTLRLWSIDQHHPRLLGVVSEAHATNISDLSWTTDAHRLFSAGFDHHVREWDFQTLTGDGGSSDIERHATRDWDLSRGLVLCLANDPADDSAIYAGTSNGFVCRLDRRAQQASGLVGSRPSSPVPGLPPRPDKAIDRVLTSASGIGMVNSMVFVEHNMLLMGDSQGFIHIFDLRKPDAALFSQLNDDAGNPIAHIQRSASGSYYAVSAFDDRLRVYDASSLRSCLQHGSANNVQLTCLRVYRGHRLDRMPLRCSLFERCILPETGPTCAETAVPKSARNSNTGRDMLQMSGETDLRTAVGSLTAMATPPRHGDDDSIPATEPLVQQRNHQTESSSDSDTGVMNLVAAAGSIDGRVFLYDCQSESLEPANILDAHSDRVYGVAFHPRELILASCSADGSIKIWA
jgi:COMPASS component SWD3